MIGSKTEETYYCHNQDAHSLDDDSDLYFWLWTYAWRRTEASVLVVSSSTGFSSTPIK